MQTKILKKQRILDDTVSDMFMSLAAMKKGWTPVTNAWLRAMMGKEQPSGSRVLAWLVLYSWGLKIKREYALFEGRKARQTDIATDLEMSKQQVNNILARLEEEGWIRIEDLCYYPLLEPTTRDARHKNDPAAEIKYWEQQAREVYADSVPKVIALKTTAYSAMNVYRSAWTKEAGEGFDRLSESNRLKLLDAAKKKKAAESEAAPKKYTAQKSSEKPAQCTESPSRAVQSRRFLNEEGNNDKPSSSSSFSAVVSALAQYGNADDDAGKTLLGKCRAIAPDVTPEEVAAAVLVKGAITEHARNPIGLLLTAVPKALPGILAQLRAVAAAPPDDVYEHPNRDATPEERAEFRRMQMEASGNTKAAGGD